MANYIIILLSFSYFSIYLFIFRNYKGTLWNWKTCFNFIARTFCGGQKKKSLLHDIFPFFFFGFFVYFDWQIQKLFIWRIRKNADFQGLAVSDARQGIQIHLEGYAKKSTSVMSASVSYQTSTQYSRITFSWRSEIHSTLYKAIHTCYNKFILKSYENISVFFYSNW